MFASSSPYADSLAPDVASGAVASGAVASGVVASGAVASGAVASESSGSTLLLGSANTGLAVPMRHSSSTMREILKPGIALREHIACLQIPVRTGRSNPSLENTSLRSSRERGTGCLVRSRSSSLLRRRSRHRRCMPCLDPPGRAHRRILPHHCCRRSHLHSHRFGSPRLCSSRRRHWVGSESRWRRYRDFPIRNTQPRVRPEVVDRSRRSDGPHRRARFPPCKSRRQRRQRLGLRRIDRQGQQCRPH